MKSLLDYFKKDPVGDFDQGQALNDASGKRNWVILGIVATLAGAVYLAADYYMTSTTKPVVQHEVIDFGAVIDSDFTEKDNQSALTAQQITLDTLQRTIDRLVKTTEGIEQSTQAANRDLKSNFENFRQVALEKIDSQIEGANSSLTNSADADPLGLGYTGQSSATGS